MHTHILPPENIQERLIGTVCQPDDDKDLAAVLQNVRAGLVVHDHFHYSCERPIRGLRLVNVASVGASPFEGDGRARYTVLSYNGSWKTDRRTVSHDIDAERRALMRSDMPGKESAAALYSGR